MTTSTQFPADELCSSRSSLESNVRRNPKSGYFVRSRRSVLGRLKTAALELALIVALIAGFIMAIVFALDLSDMLQW